MVLEEFPRPGEGARRWPIADFEALEEPPPEPSPEPSPEEEDMAGLGPAGVEAAAAASAAPAVEEPAGLRPSRRAWPEGLGGNGPGEPLNSGRSIELDARQRIGVVTERQIPADSRSTDPWGWEDGSSPTTFP